MTIELQEKGMSNPVVRIAALSLALGAFLACGDNIVDPRLPPGAVKFSPPPYYSTWWEMTKACSGRSGSLGDVTWYEVPVGVPLELDGEGVSAYWSAASNQIVISASVNDDGQVVRHEMLHALLGSKGHPRRDFLESCLGFVSCTSKCVSDAGPGPVVPAGVPRVPASTLAVTMVIQPSVVRASVNSGYFTLTVSARNTAANPVFVELPAATSFAYQFIGPNGEADQVPVLDQGVQSFAAGETKIHVFDFFADFKGTQHRHLFPGQYTVIGSFGGKAAPTQSLQIF